jgi:hypothetical protein
MKSRTAVSVVVFFLFASIAAAATPQFERMEEPTYLIEARGDQVSCRLATAREARELQPAGVPMHLIYPAPGQISTSAGLKINLQSTAQLDGFPAAKAAFVRAAQIWESRIANPITVTIDVDLVKALSAFAASLS